MSGTPGSLAGANVVILDERWIHHSPHSGYGRFIEHIPEADVIRYVMRGRASISIKQRAPGNSAYLKLDGHQIKIPFDQALMRAVLTNRYWYPLECLYAELRLMARMRRSRRSVYHLTYGEDQLGLLGQFGWPDRCKVVATFHQPPSQLGTFFRSEQPFQRLDGAIAVASNQLERLEALVGPGRVFHVPHGVDLDYWTPGPERRGDSQVRRVLSVGHWLRDFETLWKVLGDLRGKYGANLDVIIVTSAAHARAIAEWGGVRILVGISEAELRDCYRAADVTLLPLFDGTINNAILESLACGTPVVATEVGGIGDLVDGVGVLGVPPRDPGAMTRAVVSVLEADPEATARSARLVAERFGWPRVAQEILGVYDAVSRTTARRVGS